MSIRVLLLAMVLLLPACNLLTSSDDNSDSNVSSGGNGRTIIELCIFTDPNIDEVLPDWVCSESLDGVAIAALGKAEPHIAGGELYQRNQASVLARARLLEQLQAKLADKFAENLRDTKLSAVSSDGQIIQSLQQGISSQSLVGNSKIMRSLLAADENYYLLMGMDDDDVRAVIGEAIAFSMQQDPQLWLPYTSPLSAADLPSFIEMKSLP